MVQKTALVLDWDKVIFDTVRFKRYFEDVCLTFGISRDAFQETYKRIKESHNHYSFDEHVKRIAPHCGLFPSTVKSKLIDKFKNCKINFVYEDAKELLTACKIQCPNLDLILLSRGEEEFQQLKVNITGLSDIFNFKFFVQQKSKGSVLCSLLNRYYELIFIDDTFAELTSAQEFVDSHIPGLNSRIAYLWLDRHLENMDQAMDPMITWITKLTDVLKLLPSGGTNEVQA